MHAAFDIETYGAATGVQVSISHDGKLLRQARVAFGAFCAALLRYYLCWQKTAAGERLN